MTENPPRRQPKVAYRATENGVAVFRNWLADRIRDDEQRIELMGRLIGLGARDLNAFSEIIDRYERECVTASQQMPLSDRAGVSDGTEPGSEFVQRLVMEERRFVLEAQLQWIDFAREEIRDRTERQRQGLRSLR